MKVGPSHQMAEFYLKSVALYSQTKLIDCSSKDNEATLTQRQYVNCRAKMAMPSLSQLPATERLIQPGTMAMKQAANRPAPGDHSSFVSRYVEMAVNPLQHLRYTTKIHFLWMRNYKEIDLIQSRYLPMLELSPL